MTPGRIKPYQQSLYDPVTVSKQCFICKRTKPLTDFYRNRQRHDGRENQCKTCQKDHRRLRLEKITLICKVPGCRNRVVNKKTGYCNRHYIQFQRTGKILPRTYRDPNDIIIEESTAFILLRNRSGDVIARALIDSTDVDRVRDLVWHYCTGAVTAELTDGNKNSRSVTLGRYILEASEDKKVIYLNHDRLDNRRCNIRLGTHQQAIIRARLRSNNRSGATGVHYDKRKRKWRAEITRDRVAYSAGYYATFNEAVEAREKLEEKYWSDLMQVT